MDLVWTSYLYETYRRVLPEELLTQVSLDSLIQLEGEIAKNIEPHIDRDRILVQWRFVADTASIARVFVARYESALARIEKLGVEVTAAEITIRCCSSAEGVRLARAEKPTEAQIAATIKTDPEFQREYGSYLEKKREFEYVKGFYEHLRELRQLLWTRKENLLDLTEHQRRNLD
jgi:hypothetical protein